MSRYRKDTRTALVARLKTTPGLTWPVYSNPPTNIAINHVLVGDILFEEPPGKTDLGGFCTANVEIWSQTFSPADVDVVADAIVGWMDNQPLVLVGRNFMPPAFAGEQSQVMPIEAGGPVYGRVLAFRFYVE